MLTKHTASCVKHGGSSVIAKSCKAATGSGPCCCVCRRPGGRAARLKALEQGSSYQAVDRKKNVVRVILKEEYSEDVVEV